MPAMALLCILARMQDQQQFLDTVVTNQAAVTKPSLPRRYRLHRYRGPSLHVVTPNKLVVTLPVVTPYTAVVTYLGAAG